ncbi:MAG: adenosylmethionine decarboxylase [Myxococcaceae bacterium]|jgi:S-adenosylmethionine decarboxylase proenzyme|nr:adenosylmethionine decarboxylase [Myxococcaceae bacterium]MCA3015671.1 adenosylmethionine decarboxylase [Myxococcaceae bacterium]
MTAGPLATHVLLELWGVDDALLNDERALEAHLFAAARAARCEVLGSVRHRFEPQGASVVVLVAESHLSVHTWPERRYAAVDLLTCGHTLPDAGVACLVERFAPARHEVRRLDRGLPLAPVRQIP